MGRLLQIRVSAWTFSEDDVKKAYPSLWRLIWEDCADAVRKKGVMELALGIFDAVRAGLVDDKVVEALKDKVEEVDRVRLAIEKALNARDPQEADKLSYELEDRLEALEDIAQKFC